MDDICLKLIANPHKLRHYFVNTTKKEELKLNLDYYFNESISDELFEIIIEDTYYKISKEVASQVIDDMIHKIACTYISKNDIS